MDIQEQNFYDFFIIIFTDVKCPTQKNIRQNIKSNDKKI